MPDDAHTCRCPRRRTLRAIHAVLIALGLCISIATSQARYAGKQRQVSPNIKAWIEALTDQSGVGCCATADGLRPEAIDWDITANFYRVKVGKQWLVVPDAAVIKGPNRLGFAVAWLEYDWDINTGEMTTFVRCFLPGAAS